MQRQPAPASDADRAAAIAEVEAIPQLSVEQLSDQADLEVHYKLDSRKIRDKRYALTLAAKDKARVEKHGLPAELQREITTKVWFFEGEAKATYIRVLSGPLSKYPDESLEILSGPATIPKETSPEKQATANPCDAGQHQFLLQYEGEPEKTRCMEFPNDEEFKKDFFDSNIKNATGYTVNGTTWENVEYDSFTVMVVNYNNGKSEYFFLNDVGSFYYGSGTLVTLDHTYFKRSNGLIYPIFNNQIYFNEVLTPRIIAHKNGLQSQVKELRDLYNLLQAAGAFAQIVALNAITEDFRTTLQDFRRTRGSVGKGKGSSGGTGSEPKTTGIPEPIGEDEITQPIRPGEATGGEMVGPYRVNAERRMNGETYEVDVYGLYREGGRGGADPEKKSDIRPIMNLARSLINEGKANNAKDVKIYRLGGCE